MEMEENVRYKMPSATEKLCELQRSIYFNSDDHDTILISADGTVFKSHRLILSGSSEFFHLLLKDVPISNIPTIYIPDVDTTIMELLLAFIYLGEVDMPMLLTSTFFDTCNYLQIKAIKDINGIGMTLRNSTEQDEQETNELLETYVDVDKSEEPAYLILEDDPHNKDDISSEGEIAIEYLDSEVAEENSNLDYDLNMVVTDLEVEAQEDMSPSKERNYEENTFKARKRSPSKRFSGKRIKTEIDRALNEISTGKTIHQLSLEYKVPRSTLYHKFRSNDTLKKNYRTERKTAMQLAVAAVLEKGISLTKAAEQFSVPKTGIWRELRKTDEYQAPSKDVSEARLQAQDEIIAGKSLTSISIKYKIPLTTVHRDKKRLSKEGKLPESLKIKDRTENSEYGKRLEQALESCRQGMSQYQASKMYNIPKATMWRYANALLRNTVSENSVTGEKHLKNCKLEISD